MNKTTVAINKCANYSFEELYHSISSAISLCGGFPESVKPGAKILLKPNLITERPPEDSVTTHPEVVRAVVRCLKAIGITDIYLGDSPASDRDFNKLWEVTGMKKVCDDEHIKLIEFRNSKILDFKEKEKVPILKELDMFDAIISLPKLKTHILTKITATVKNSYGLVLGSAKSHFHSRYPSPRKMSVFIGELYGYLRPDFVIMDAVDCMEGDGPSSGNSKHIGLIFASKDGVAADSCACEVFEYTYKDILHLKVANDKGFGVADPLLINKVGDGVNILGKEHCKHSKADFMFKIPENLFVIITLITRSKPKINVKKCVKCGACKKICSQGAIVFKKGNFKVQQSKCILCMCCIETCEYKAVKLKMGYIWKLLVKGRLLLKRRLKK